MPYIAINTSVQIPDAQKEKIKTEIGRLITIIPTKTEAGTMVDFCDCRTMYFAGKKVNGAFIELRLFRKSEFEAKKKFVEELFKFLMQELGMTDDLIKINIIELDEWGGGGTLRT